MRIALVGPLPIKDASKLLFEVDDGHFDLFANDRGISVLTTAKALLGRGHEVTLITTDRNTDQIQVFEKGAIRLIIVPRRRKLKSQVVDLYKRERSLLTKVIDSEASQVVNAQWTYEYALAALNSSKSVIVTVHDAPLSIFLKFRDFLRFLHLLIAIKVRLHRPKLIFVSPFIAKKWCREMFWKGQIEIVPNIGLTFKPGEKNTAKLMKCISVTESGRLKNTLALIESWPTVISICPDAVLALVGHGMEYGGALQKLALSRGLDQRIEWLGFLDHERVLDEIANSTLLISTSRQESFGLTILEAMSLGVPVLAGANSGAPAWVLGDAGYLVNVKKPSEIASGVIKILTDEKMQKKMAMNGLTRSVSEFSVSVVCEKLEKIYSDLASVG